MRTENIGLNVPEWNGPMLYSTIILSFRREWARLVSDQHDDKHYGVCCGLSRDEARAKFQWCSYQEVVKQNCVKVKYVNKVLSALREVISSSFTESQHHQSTSSPTESRGEFDSLYLPNKFFSQEKTIILKSIKKIFVYFKLLPNISWHHNFIPI